MPDMTFNTAAGQAIERNMMVAFLNTAANADTPNWSPMGAYVSDSALGYDWQKDSSTDVLGVRRATMKKPQMTQTFTADGVSSDDAALVKIWNMGVKEQNYTALANQDVLIVHKYAGTSGTAFFAERYSGASVSLTSLGGEGGGNLTAEYEVEYAGTRTTGTASIAAGGSVTFSADE